MSEPVSYALLSPSAHPPEPKGDGSILLLRTASVVKLEPDVPQLIHLKLRLGLPDGCAGHLSLLPSWGLDGVRLLDSFLLSEPDGAAAAVEDEVILMVVWSPLALTGDSSPLTLSPGTAIAIVTLLKSHVPAQPPVEALQGPRVTREDSSAAPEGAVPPAQPRPWWHHRGWLFPGFGFGHSR